MATDAQVPLVPPEAVAMLLAPLCSRMGISMSADRDGVWVRLGNGCVVRVSCLPDGRLRGYMRAQQGRRKWDQSVFELDGLRAWFNGIRIRYT